MEEFGFLGDLATATAATHPKSDSLGMTSDADDKCFCRGRLVVYKHVGERSVVVALHMQARGMP